MPEVEITSCGKTLHIPDIYAGDYAEEVEIRDRWWHISAGEMVLDIGSSVGTYTLPALARGATVIAVDVLEQVPIAQIVQRNDLAAKAVFIHAAVGDDDGYPPELAAAVTADPATYPGLGDCLWTTVDRLVAGFTIRRVDWIKIDTEGAEVPIMRGARATLERDHPRLLIEEHSHLPHIAATGNAAQLRRLLTGYGYTIETAPYKERALWFCTWPGGVTDAA